MVIAMVLQVSTEEVFCLPSRRTKRSKKRTEEEHSCPSPPNRPTDQGSIERQECRSSFYSLLLGELETLEECWVSIFDFIFDFFEGVTRGDVFGAVPVDSFDVEEEEAFGFGGVVRLYELSC